jgi:hypothetical protein
MASIFTEPLGGEITYTQWQRLIQKTTFETGGFMALSLTNMNSASAPQIAGGSRVEAGGSLYLCAASENIAGTPAAGINYVYCVPAGALAGFAYSAAAPAWDAAKGGWYNGNNRAVARLYFTGSGGGSQYNGKAILDSYNAVRALNTEQAVPASGGIAALSVPAADVNKVLAITLPAGAYRYEVKAGKGGKGGDAEDSTGGGGADGEAKTGGFVLPAARAIRYALGGDGGNGGFSWNAGGGGGGGTGGSAFIDTGDEFILCLGGSGGGGGGGTYGDSGGQIGGGGGGAGGYGAGAAGASGAARDGKGGSGGAGGAGGTVSSSGAGGAGSGNNNYGGDGEDGALTGGAGGVSQTGENAASAADKYPYRVQWQGGGGGGGTINRAGGAGGGPLKASSSGYLRIYRMW